MKLCIPTITNEGKTAPVSEHFGSAPYFTVYDTEEDAIEIIPNNNEHHSHGACHPLSALNGKAIDAVVCGGMGRRAILMLREQNIKAFRTGPGAVEETVQAFKKNELEELTPETGCARHGCH